MNKVLKALIVDITPPVGIRALKEFRSVLGNLSRVLFPKGAKKHGLDFSDKYLYYGNLFPSEKQFANDRFLGLTLTPLGIRDLEHNAYEPLPCKDCTIEKVQSQDVFEHLEYEKIPSILDEIYRVLKPGGVFRLSVPDYNSPFMLKRSVFDESGNVIADLMCGGTFEYDAHTGTRQVSFPKGGDAHLWFPTFESVSRLISMSRISESSEIKFYHYFSGRDDFTCHPFPENEMFVMRAPPVDMRSDGKPVSIVVDFVK